MRLTGETEHAAYPHLFGSLFDCPACEARCYCRPNETECVHCAIGSESANFTEKQMLYVRHFTY